MDEEIDGDFDFMAPLSLTKLHLGFSKCQRHCCQFDPLPNVCFLLITKCLIVVLLVASEPTSPSAPRQKAYVFTFLLSARLFIPPPELLARVCELCIKQQQLDQSPLDTVGTAQHANTHEAKTVAAAADLYDRVFPLDDRRGCASLAPKSCSC